MDTRYSHVCQRDTSVSLLRVKMSRRRSQTQKENRERTVNTRRQLEKLTELDVSSLDASVAMVNMSVIQEKTVNSASLAKKMAVEERLKQLERWKERKALQMEKKRREKESKGVFKTGVYHAKDTFSLPAVPTASTKAKEIKGNTAPSQSTRITRSMKQQQQVQRPLKMQDPNTTGIKAQAALDRSTRSRVAPVKPASVPAKTKANIATVEPVVRVLPARSANRPPVTKAPAVKDKPKDKSTDVRSTRSRALVNAVAPLSGKARDCKETVNNTAQPVGPKEPDDPTCTPSPALWSETEDKVVTQALPDSVSPVDPCEASSFAPRDFIFQAPIGLAPFKFEPLTPRSADAFLTPNLSFSLPPAPVFNLEPQGEPIKVSPSKSPRCSPPHMSLAVAPPTPASPVESKHDVPYFRSEIANETHRLTGLCFQWEAKVEDDSVPEEMRDRMRTAVGQARLLMKERFNQFGGLVDDCELGRGEKITTCTDLQGFWDMVYYQVEDVIKKFDALKEAESRGWVEEHKPPPRQKRVVKKPSAAPAKSAGSKEAAKSRLAAVKAAMKARQQAAENSAKDAVNNEDETGPNSKEPQSQVVPQTSEAVVFDGGFFQVQSPTRQQGSLRRSSRLSAAVHPQASSCSNSLSPRRVTRQSLALAQTPVRASPAQPFCTPARLSQTPKHAPKSLCGTPQTSQKRRGTVNVSLRSTPVKEVLSDDHQPNGILECQPEPVSECSMPTRSHALPSISVTEEQSKPTEAFDIDLPSPCKTIPEVSPALESSSCLSFTMSPCVTPSQAPVPFPIGVNDQDTSAVEEIPGLDFERYLQPSQRCSLSPRETVAIETLSPLATDVDMESPRVQSEDLLTQQKAAAPAVSSLSTLHSPQTAHTALLLFTPDPKDRIRQSVCPSDLMVFTPPL